MPGYLCLVVFVFFWGGFGLLFRVDLWYSAFLQITACPFSSHIRKSMTDKASYSIGSGAKKENKSLLPEKETQCARRNINFSFGLAFYTALTGLAFWTSFFPCSSWESLCFFLKCVCLDSERSLCWLHDRFRFFSVSLKLLRTLQHATQSRTCYSSKFCLFLGTTFEYDTFTSTGSGMVSLSLTHSTSDLKYGWSLAWTSTVTLIKSNLDFV